MGNPQKRKKLARIQAAKANQNSGLLVEMEQKTLESAPVIEQKADLKIEVETPTVTVEEKLPTELKQENEPHTEEAVKTSPRKKKVPV
jgi:hypothetical protein